MTGGMISAEPCLTPCRPSLRVTLQVLVWPQLLSPLCSPRTTMCSWAGHFTISSTRSERPSPGHPATTPGMLSETVPVVCPATAPTCSRPANSSLSENSALHFHLHIHTIYVLIFTGGNGPHWNSVTLQGAENYFNCFLRQLYVFVLVWALLIALKCVGWPNITHTVLLKME